MTETDGDSHRGFWSAPHSRRDWWGAAIALVVLCGLGALAATSIDFAELQHALGKVDLYLIGAGFLFMIGAFLARGESWFVVIDAALPDAHISRVPVTRALLIGMATSSVTPGRLGEFARAWLVARRLGPPRQHLVVVAGTLVAQTLMNLLALIILTVIALLGGGIAHGKTEGLLAVVAIPLGILLVAFLAPSALARTARQRTGRIASSVNWLAGQIVAARRGLSAFGHLAKLLHSVGAQLGAWALQLGCCYVTLRAFNLHVSAALAAAAGVLVATNLTAIVPITPSNVGVFQAATIAVLAGFGVSAGAALAYGLVLQGIEVISALALGGLSLINEGVPWTQLRSRSGEAQ